MNNLFPIKLFAESSEHNTAKPPAPPWFPCKQERGENKPRLTTVTNPEALWEGSDVLFSAPGLDVYEVSWGITNGKTEGVSFSANVCKK